MCFNVKEHTSKCSRQGTCGCKTSGYMSLVKQITLMKIAKVFFINIIRFVGDIIIITTYNREVKCLPSQLNILDCGDPLVMFPWRRWDNFYRVALTSYRIDFRWPSDKLQLAKIRFVALVTTLYLIQQLPSSHAHTYVSRTSSKCQGSGQHLHIDMYKQRPVLSTM